MQAGFLSGPITAAHLAARVGASPGVGAGQLPTPPVTIAPGPKFPLVTASLMAPQSGTLHGVAAIPERWLPQLELRDEIEALALELLVSAQHER
jgi:hypothetical protein